MPFLIIPALDLAGGRLARFAREGPVATEAFGGDPLAAAERFLTAGASWLHVVDLDLAFAPGDERGRPSERSPNREVVRALAALPVRIQAAGGLATPEEVGGMLDAGAERAVLGSAGLRDRASAERLIADLGERLVVGIEEEGGRIRPRGGVPEDLELAATLAWVTAAGPARYVYTAVGRVGGLRGPDLAGLGDFVHRVRRPVLASGGIAVPEDLGRLAETGAEGAIVGRALLEGRIPLEVLSG